MSVDRLCQERHRERGDASDRDLDPACRRFLEGMRLCTPVELAATESKHLSTSAVEPGEPPRDDHSLRLGGPSMKTEEVSSSTSSIPSNDSFFLGLLGRKRLLHIDRLIFERRLVGAFVVAVFPSTWVQLAIGRWLSKTASKALACRLPTKHASRLTASRRRRAFGQVRQSSDAKDRIAVNAAGASMDF
jgi:hypothetical protein